MKKKTEQTVGVRVRKRAWKKLRGKALELDVSAIDMFDMLVYGKR